MNLPVDVKIDDYPLAMKMKNSLTLGHYFAFVDAKTDRGRGRVSRLLVEPTPSHRVIPLVGESFSVAGMTLTPRKRSIDPLGAVVTDRDLYRAEQDTVYLFVAVPEPPEGARPRGGVERRAADFAQARPRGRRRHRNLVDASSRRLSGAAIGGRQEDRNAGRLHRGRVHARTPDRTARFP